MFQRRLVNFFKRKMGAHVKESYSQCGEDIIVRYIFDVLKIARPTYLDIGAHHPCALNNTAIFYKQGSRGVNVEADPSLIGAFNEARRHDINLNVGMAAEAGCMEFYIMSAQTLSTFSPEEAKRYEKKCGYEIKSIVPIQVQTFSQIVDENLNGQCPDFISLDVEGLDYEILNSIDFRKYRPHVFCVETIIFTQERDSGDAGRHDEIDVLMRENDYIKYADTNINTIYVNSRSWFGS